MSIITARTLVLLPTTTVTATGAGAHIVLPWQFTACTIKATTAAAGGTSPTLDLKIQEGFRAVGAATAVGQNADGAYGFHDWAAFAQITTNTTRIIRVVGGGEEEAATTDGTLTAGTILNGSIPGILRVKYVIGGTSPTFSLTVIGFFMP